MKTFISDNPKGKHGIHRYAPEELGVDPGAIHEAFGSYMTRFDLTPEEL